MNRQQYRRRDPEDADELEFMENVFDALCAVLSEPPNKQAFLDEEGGELGSLQFVSHRPWLRSIFADSGADGPNNEREKRCKVPINKGAGLRNVWFCWNAQLRAFCGCIGPQDIVCRFHE